MKQPTDVRILHAVVAAVVVGISFFFMSGLLVGFLAAYLSGDSDNAALGLVVGIPIGILSFLWYYSTYRSRQEKLSRIAGGDEYDDDPRPSRRARRGPRRRRYY